METAVLLPPALEAIDRALFEHADEITALDQAIGDGDHVFNLQRGLTALLEDTESLGRMAWPDAFKAVGLRLMSTVGGASGSLYGTFFLALGKSLQGQTVDRKGFAQAWANGVAAMKARGKADLGEKTMLDVLIPVSHVLTDCAEQDDPIDTTADRIRTAASAGVEATRDLVATKGRASFLGERARGHIDAGAKTAQLMIDAACGVWVS